LKPHELALFMEDDVAIPDDWRFRMQKAVDMAPPNWELLKLSGWGAARVNDLMNASVPLQPPKEDVSVLDEQIDSAKNASIWGKFTHAFSSMFSRDDNDVIFFEMREPFTEPARFNWGTLGWGSPNYFYAGTGAYIVRGSAIKKVIRHLRSRPLDDLDGMMLSNGSTHFYEGFPHVFDLGRDAFHGPGLHGRKAFDEFDNGTRSEADQLEATETLRLGSSRKSSQDGDQTLVTNSRGAIIRHRAPAHAAPERDEHTDTDFDVGSAEERIMRRSAIRAHNHTRASDASSRSSLDAARAPPIAEQNPVSASLDFGHPEWLRYCAVVYLDVGSNDGLQVQKLLEPERYASDDSLMLFNQSFGSPSDRKMSSTTSGLCALGMEPNPAHRSQLQKLEENYTARGWHVHFYPYAAWKDEGTMMFDEAQDLGAKLTNEGEARGNANASLVTVRTVNLGDFVRSLPPHSVKLMKVDIAGAEYETVWRMLQMGVLCQGRIDAAMFSDHSFGDISGWQDERSYASMAKRINASDCGVGGVPTRLYKVNSEAVITDYSPAETLADYKATEALDEQKKTATREKFVMYGFGLTASAFAVWLGVQKTTQRKGEKDITSSPPHA